MKQMKIAQRILNALGLQRKGEMPFMRSYAGAQSSRFTADWVSAYSSADAELRYALTTLRARARDMVQNNDYARKFVALAVSNIVGADGFKLQCRVKDDNGASDEMANRMIEAAFADWSRAANCTVTKKLSFRALQELVVRTVVRDGEAYIRIVRGREYKYGFALQVIEPDLIDEKANEVLSNGNIVRMGVELDELRRPVAYHAIKPDPTNEFVTGTITGETVRIPAEEMIHIYDIERASQTRGVTWFAASMMRLKMLTGFEEASLINARASAAKMGFFKSQMGLEYTGDSKDDAGNIIQYAQPGSFSQLPPGMDFVPFTPQYPSDQHEPFVKSILRGIASGLGCSYNTLANDLEGVNYSSIRAGLIDERETWKRGQALIIEQLLERVYPLWLDMAMLTGNINLPFRKFGKFLSAEWIGRRWQWVDPMKDIQASLLAIDGGLKTRASVIAEQGGDIYDTFEQLAVETAMAEKFNLKFESTNGQNNIDTAAADAGGTDGGARPGGRAAAGDIGIERAAG